MGQGWRRTGVGGSPSSGQRLRTLGAIKALRHFMPFMPVLVSMAGGISRLNESLCVRLPQPCMPIDRVRGDIFHPPITVTHTAHVTLQDEEIRYELQRVVRGMLRADKGGCSLSGSGCTCLRIPPCVCMRMGG